MGQYLQSLIVTGKKKEQVISSSEYKEKNWNHDE